MNDRELLEMAAIASGMDLTKWKWADDGESQYFICMKSFWNPLTDDGDALRLAVQLGIIVCVDHELGYCGIHLAGHRGKYDLGEKLGGDPYTATRRAIVRGAVLSVETPFE